MPQARAGLRRSRRRHPRRRRLLRSGGPTHAPCGCTPPRADY